MVWKVMGEMSSMDNAIPPNRNRTPLSAVLSHLKSSCKGTVITIVRE